MGSGTAPRRTLDGVLEDLDSIVHECRVAGSYAGLFGSMYRSVTVQVHDLVRSGGFFEDAGACVEHPRRMAPPLPPEHHEGSRPSTSPY